MFIEPLNHDKTLFEVMHDFDISSDTEQRAKDLRHAISYYNSIAGTNHILTSELLASYWIYCETRFENHLFI